MDTKKKGKGNGKGKGDTAKGRIAVLIPTYNEAKTIGKVVKEFRRALPEAKIYVYDNDSTDESFGVAERAGAIVKRECRRGKGNVMRSMFRNIDADCYLMVDADDTYPVNVAREMCEYVLNDEADMVVGDRLSSTYFKENKRMFHGFGNRLVRRMINLIFRSNIKDVMSGYRAFSRVFVKTCPVLSKGFEIETEMTIHALDKNFSIKEIPINYKTREDGSSSKLHTVRDGFKVILTIIRLFEGYKPALFFSILSFMFFVLSLILGVPVVVEYFDTGLVPRFPTLIVSGFSMAIAVMMLVCGIILQVVVRKNRELFELFLFKY